MMFPLLSGRGYIECDGFEQKELIANVYQDHRGVTWYGYGVPLWADCGHPGTGYRVRIKSKSFADRALVAVKRMLGVPA